MAFYLKDLATNPGLLDDMRSRQPRAKCAECGNDEVQPVYGGRCEDCYYEKLGRLVEEHPIPSAGVQRS